MVFGKSIRLHLPDGKATGLKHAEIINWTGQALSCPRSRFSEIKEWEAFARPGIYFLLARGSELDAFEGSVYIGESENVTKRLPNHKKKEFWNEVIMVTNKDENLTKAHSKYLESRLIEIASDAKRYKLENDCGSNEALLPRADKDCMDEFIENLKILIGVLGYDFLEKLPEAEESIKPEVQQLPDQSKEHPCFVLKIKGLEARGTIHEKGFVVFKGSELVKESKSSATKTALVKREHCLEMKELVERDHAYTLTQSILFTSASTAGSFVTGTSCNGRTSWITEEGVTLKDWEEQVS